jgi:hypothetical protein
VTATLSKLGFFAVQDAEPSDWLILQRMFKRKAIYELATVSFATENASDQTPRYIGLT